MGDKGKTFMGIQFPEPPERWEPQRAYGYEKLNDSEKILADSLSILEQKITFALETAHTALSLVILLAKVMGIMVVLLLAVNGPALLKVGLKWIGVEQTITR